MHCSLLAEDAIKSAIKDYQSKREKRLAALAVSYAPPALCKILPTASNAYKAGGGMCFQAKNCNVQCTVLTDRPRSPPPALPPLPPPKHTPS